MSQRRLLTYGNLVDTEDLPTAVANLFNPGRLRGNVFETAGVNLLRVSPGSALLPNGVIILEDEGKNLVIPPSSLNADYTIVYQLEDSRVLGGSPALLKALAGINRQEDFDDAVILGWVRYPGGSIPLAPTHFIQPASVRITSQPARYIYSEVGTFPSAMRPEGERMGATVLRTFEFSDITTNGSQTLSLGGVKGRVLQATVTVNSGVPANNVNYLTASLKKGATTLFNYDTRAAAQNTIPPASSRPLSKNTTIAASDFIINETEQLTVQIQESGVVPASSGQISVLLELPASSGSWSEKTEIVSNEICTTFKNVSNAPGTYSLKVPFMVTAEGQPKKLIARLLVDFNCIVTFSLHLASGVTVTLQPNGGIVSNTATLVTREFEILSDPTVEFEPATSAYLEMSINAQAGRGVSLSTLALTQEPSPFQLF